MINRPNFNRPDLQDASKAAAANKLNLPFIPMRKPTQTGASTGVEASKPLGLGFGAKFGMLRKELVAAPVEPTKQVSQSP